MVRGENAQRTAHLEHLKRGQEFSGFLGTPVDLEPFQAGHLVFVLAKVDAWFADSSAKKFGFANLELN